MKRLMKLCLAAITLMPMALSGGARAADSGFTPGQRQDIIAIIRQALKADPSILRDAVAALQSDDDAKQAVEARGLIVANKSALVAKQDDPTAGNPAGDVSLVEFYDPRCPYCRKMMPAIDAMLQRDHNLRLVLKDIPVLGPASVMETRAILAAKIQGGYFKMQAALMKDTSPPSADMVKQVGKSLGLNTDKLLADMNSDAVTKKIHENMDLAHTLKVQGTPAFVVGDQMIPGAVDPGQLEMAVADTRKHAAR